MFLFKIVVNMPTFDTMLAKEAGTHYDWWVVCTVDLIRVSGLIPVEKIPIQSSGADRKEIKS